MPTNRYFIDFSYDGSSYHGFQKQLNAITVQEIMENTISKILFIPDEKMFNSHEPYIYK